MLAGGAGWDGKKLIKGQDAGFAAFPAWKNELWFIDGGRGGIIYVLSNLSALHERLEDQDDMYILLLGPRKSCHSLCVHTCWPSCAWVDNAMNEMLSKQ